MTNTFPFRNYRVLFTPLVGQNRYGDAIDVTQDVDLTDWIMSLGKITKEIDNGDYDFGIFTFGDITLKAINYDRRFNTPDDPRSMFKYRRDRCKVDIYFYDEDGNSSTHFKGLINDDATRLDFQKNQTRIKVLSVDSIFRQVSVPAGSIVSTDNFSTAIKKILNVPEITTTLTYSASNVNVDLDLQIDDGEFFSNMVAKEALDLLLLASNSILYVDRNNTIYVKSRRESVNQFDLYGSGDLYGRENILSVKEYNNGLQRAFSSIQVNDDTVVTDSKWVYEYGFRQKSVNLDFITNLDTEELIAQRLLDSFKIPKPELELEVISKSVNEIELLDMCSVSYNYRYSASGGETSVPLWGENNWGSFRWPKPTGAFRILPKTKWKVIGIEEDPAKFKTKLKLRQAGTERHDGVFI